MRGSRCQGVYFNEHLNFELALLPVDLGLRTILPSRRRWPLLQPLYFSFGNYNEIIHVISTEKPFPMLLWFGNYNEIFQIISTVVPFPMLLWFRKCRKYGIILKIIPKQEFILYVFIYLALRSSSCLWVYSWLYFTFRRYNVIFHVISFAR